MPGVLSKRKGSRNETLGILNDFLQAQQLEVTKKAAIQKVADNHGISFDKVRGLVSRFNPKFDEPLKLHGNHRLTMAEEMLTVGHILGMANISKPLNIQELLKILNARYAKDGKRMKETWARGFCRRWSHHVHMKETRLISAGRSNPSNLSNVEAFVKFQAEFMAEFYHLLSTSMKVGQLSTTRSVLGGD